MGNLGRKYENTAKARKKKSNRWEAAGHMGEGERTIGAQKKGARTINALKELDLPLKIFRSQILMFSAKSPHHDLCAHFSFDALFSASCPNFLPSAALVLLFYHLPHWF